MPVVLSVNIGSAMPNPDQPVLDRHCEATPVDVTVP
jgi:hypothetical protein